MPKINILVVDDNVIVREGLKSLLNLENDINVLGEAASTLECIKVLDQYDPDVVLMDLKMPGIGGIEGTSLIKQKHPHVKVVLLTNYDDEEYIQKAINVGVDGYVLKDIKKGDLAEIVRTVARGRGFIDPSVTYKVFRTLKQAGLPKEESFLAPTFSERELQILECLVEGKSNKETAETIYVAVDTVKSHLKSIYHKLGVHTRSKAVRSAIQQGIVHL